MTLTEWAARWHLPQEALAELAACSIVAADPDGVVSEKSEAYVMSANRLDAARKGLYLWRNNNGATVSLQLKDLCDVCRAKARRPIRFGLGNDSRLVNESIKSGDLIGGRPLVIRPEHVGFKILRFVSLECKREDWTYKGTSEELAQVAWATLINSLGGEAYISNKVGIL